MTEPKLVEKTPNARTMDRNAAPSQFHAQFVQSRFAVAQHSLLEPVVMRGQLSTANVPLATRSKRAGLTFENNQVVHEAR